MNANEVIESYVSDVAVHLPRRERHDVAFELRALLGEELQARADAAGRAADAEMATALANSFGRPVDVAARYRTPLTIIDPADGPAFLRATLIGLAVVWSLGLWKCLREPSGSDAGLLGALGAWWGGTVIPSLWWPGVLVVSFGLAAWTRRRSSDRADWKPRAADRMPGNRATLALGILGILAGVFLLLDPRLVLDLFWGGRAAPEAYQALTYTETFRQRQGPYLLVLVLLNIPLLVSAIATGRRSAIMRKVDMELGLVTCAVMAWTVADGPALVAPAGDQGFKLALTMLIVITLAGFGLRLQRGVRPGPDPRLQAQR